MKERCTFLIFILVPLCAFAQENIGTRYLNLVRQGTMQRQQRQYTEALDSYLNILQITPDHPGYQYEAARMYILNEQWEKALIHFQQALILGYPAAPEIEEDFLPLLERDGSGELAALFARCTAPVLNSTVAFTIPERDLTPECITYDPVNDRFFLGSMWKHKIVALDRDGSVTDFTSEKQDGLRSIAGMRVDPERRLLWVLTIVSSIVPSCDLSMDGWSGLFAYDCDTGALAEKIELFKEGEKHLLNDLTLTEEGDLYITDSQAGAVYYHAAGSDSLERWLAADAFIFPNGIALNDEETSLYISASSMGVFRIDRATKSYQRLALPDTVSLYGIDGMYWHRNSLVCVQNGLKRISRFYLSSEAGRVAGAEIIERGNPVFSLPTTGVIVDDQFYYIANSQIYRMDGTRRLLPAEQLDDIRILRTAL